MHKIMITALMLLSFTTYATAFDIRFTGQANTDADTLVLLSASNAPQQQESLKQLADSENFSGKAGQNLQWLAPAAPYSNYKRVVLLGVGNAAEHTANTAAIIGADLARFLAKSAAKNIVIDASQINSSLADTELAAQLAFGATLSAYTFNRYKAKPTGGKADTKGQQLNFVVANASEAQRRHAQLSAIANGVILARDLTNEPAMGLSPANFADKASELKKLGVKVTVFDENALQKNNMGAILAVGRGSARPPRLVIAHWQGSQQAPLAIIGKGITFDTGGYNLKTQADSIIRMTSDMAGAAAALGTIAALAEQKAAVNVVAVMALAENMISDRAYLPGDVVNTAAGISVEIINTDAEGRMVMADALWYAEKHYKPRAMVDIATLTGAKVTALGAYYAGVFSNNDNLVMQLQQAGQQVNEKLWRLPLSDDMLPELKSRIADLRNGGRSAGASTAALFLQQFVGNTPFAHIDIAGNALANSNSGITPEGATGYGVQLLTQWALTQP
ncbi:leucyl aminopeptidase [Rheinheimera oceanensis]|uniref:leucyl aminopeptidase n=1 Tax=Rheinheimera oceanensis TaxID=2817449 RepID=UPI001BFE4371|nr:leucyl aminopeptidase [Rheinheimera oceanensis]